MLLQPTRAGRTRRRSSSWTISTSRSRRSCLSDVGLEGHHADRRRAVSRAVARAGSRRATRAAASACRVNSAACLSSMCTPSWRPARADSCSRRSSSSSRVSTRQQLVVHRAAGTLPRPALPGPQLAGAPRGRSPARTSRPRPRRRPPCVRRLCANSGRLATSVVGARSRSWRQTRIPSRVHTTSGSTESAPLRQASW